MRGQRFELDLDPEEAYARSQGAAGADVTSPSPAPLGLDFVKDVLERPMADTSSSAPPAPPSLKNSSAGWPAPRKRASRFKQTRGGDSEDNDAGRERAAGQAVPSPVATQGRGPGTYLSKLSRATDAEKADIDAQTTQMLANMDSEELAEARSELMNDPSFAAIRRLLMRSSIDNDQAASGSSSIDDVTTSKDDAGKLTSMKEAEDKNGLSGGSASRIPEKQPGSSASKKKVSFVEETGAGLHRPSNASDPVSTTRTTASTPIFAPTDIMPVSTSITYRTSFYQQKYGQRESPNPVPASSDGSGTKPAALPSSTPPTASSSHPSQTTISRAPSTLDPNSETFLSDLHSTYYPDLPSDPSRLAWMAPIETDPASTSASSTPSSREPSSATESIVPASQLRFDFRGAIVSAARSACIPVTKGLHHHGRDPGAAGYTLAELAIYEHSTNAGQRCFAYQLLGRVLYRLGTGAFRLDGRRRVRQMSSGDNDAAAAGQDQDRSVDATATGEVAAESDIVDDLPLDAREEGLWREVHRGHILQQMLTEAAREPGTGSESARIWALEAVWLWRRGGGKGLEAIANEEAESEVMGDAAAQILQEGLNPQF